MTCRNCGAGLEAGRIDSTLGVVTCSHCGSLHDIPGDGPVETAVGDVGRSEGRVSRTAAKPRRLDVSLPERFNVRRSSGGMEVSWAVGGMFPGLALTIIACGFSYAAVNSGQLFLLIAAAALFYFAATKAFNKHRIRVDGARLEVTQGPLPWPGSRKLNAADIEQLFATEHESQVKTASNKQTVQVHKFYRLSANTRGGRRVTILSGLSDPLQALWLEQELERLLGISDRRVTGEHSY